MDDKDPNSKGEIMKFLIITEYDRRQIDAEDFEDAVSQAYNYHTGYDNVIAIIKIESE